MKTGVTVTKDDVKKVVASMLNLTHQRVMVGVPATQGERQPEAGEKQTINNAALAYIHNYGAPEANIPQREFMEPGIRAAQDRITEGLKAASLAALDFKPDDMDKAMQRVGLVAQASIRNKINTGPFEALSERTLAARARRGVTRTKPLIDTGQLRNAINYVIRKV